MSPPSTGFIKIFPEGPLEIGFNFIDNGIGAIDHLQHFLQDPSFLFQYYIFLLEIKITDMYKDTTYSRKIHGTSLSEPHRQGFLNDEGSPTLTLNKLCF